ncbi:hypothetical protein WKK05_17945 [Nostoc sp. UHCC 0302]|uniref:hypothetical protein n=1 Tax=Nostoc sp. UHCC 0302 TaxID=3134896 RepID=UPI00311CDE20
MNTLDKNQSEQNTTSRNSSGNKGRWDLVIMATLVMMAAMVKTGIINVEDPKNSPQLTSTSELVTNPDEFMSKTVTIKSKPIQKVGLSSFTVDDKQLFSNNSIVVVNASGVPFDLPIGKNIEVQVTGEVRQLKLPEIEREFSLNLEEKYYTKYINKPAIIAQSIKLADQDSQNAQLQ